MRFVTLKNQIDYSPVRHASRDGLRMNLRDYAKLVTSTVSIVSAIVLPDTVVRGVCQDGARTDVTRLARMLIWETALFAEETVSLAVNVCLISGAQLVNTFVARTVYPSSTAMFVTRMTLLA